MDRPVAVILAAGRGMRLAPLTHDRPKALIEVNGRSLLERSITALGRAGFQRAVVVTGYRSDLVVKMLLAREWGLEVAARFNPAFATANNIVSFLAIQDLVTDGFCLLNSDIVFDESILDEVMRPAEGTWLAIDRDVRMAEEEMKVELDDHGLIVRISKSLSPKASAGEYIGIARFDAAGARLALEAARSVVEEGGVDRYYEDAFDRGAEQLAMRCVPTAGRLWTEIDDLADHARAEVIAEQLDAVEAF